MLLHQSATVNLLIAQVIKPRRTQTVNRVEAPKQRDDESVTVFVQRINSLFRSEFGSCNNTLSGRRFRRKTKKQWLRAGVNQAILPFVLPRMLANNDDTVWNDLVVAFQDAEWRYRMDKLRPLQKAVPKSNPFGFIVDKDGFIVVYTDGACTNNGRSDAKAGIGVWFGENHRLNVSKPLSWRRPATNNVAEVSAVLHAIEIVRGAGFRRVAIHSDSDYLKKSLHEYIKKWLCNGWVLSSGEPVKHKNYFRAYFRLIEDMNIKWVFVRGHKGIRGNVEADTLARNGAKLDRRDEFTK